MDQNILEKTLSLPQFFVTVSSLYLVGETILSYLSTSHKSEKLAKEKGIDYAQSQVREDVESIQNHGWIYRNILMAGTMVAYERFLSRGED